MSQSKRKTYSKDFKIEAVKLVKERGIPFRQVADDLGIHVAMLTRWVKELAQSGDVAFPGQGKATPEQEAIRELENENRRLRMERDILKKAMAYFATEPG